jgi:hypothetical protein
MGKSPSLSRSFEVLNRFYSTPKPGAKRNGQHHRGEFSQ